MLFDYWGDIPVRVESFVGQWVPLDPADLNRVGLLNSRLGVDLTVGDQVYDRGGVFNTAVGPVDWATYQSFVPGGFRYRQNRALTRLYCCDPLGFTLQVTLRPGEVPPMHLTSEEGGSALGMTSSSPKRRSATGARPAGRDGRPSASRSASRIAIRRCASRGPPPAPRRSARQTTNPIRIALSTHRRRLPPPDRAARKGESEHHE